MPLYSSRTAIVVREQSYTRLKPGMAVVYRHTEGHYVAHVIVEQLRAGWIAAGLTNAESDDELVTRENLVGVITAAYSSSPNARREAFAGATLREKIDQGQRTASIP